MQITSTIKKNGNLFGLYIQDGSETYPVRIESIHTPMILDTLLAEGWELHGLPYDIRKGSMTLNDLPSLEYVNANISEEQEQDMIDMMAQRYKEVDLKSKMVQAGIKYIDFRKSTNGIKTRDELISFLKATVSHNIDLDVPRAYVPLNSFVSQAALFTPEEYFSSDNAEIRSLIETRRSVSYKNFVRLVKFLVATGMPENYTSKELVDYYFSWGVCGIKFDAYDRKTNRSNLILGAPLPPDRNEDEMPYVKMRHLTYMTTDGQVHKTNATSIGRWIPTLREGALESKRKEAAKAGYEYIAPVYVESVIDEECTTITGEKLVMEYTDERLQLTHDGTVHKTNTISVRRLDDAYKFLPSHYWNIVSEEGKRRIFEEFYIHAICKQISDKTTVRVNVSSYKALQSVGAGPLSVFHYMIEKNPMLKDTMGDVKPEEKDMLVVHVENYLKEKLNKNKSFYDDVETFVQDVIEGAVNVDNTADGQEADNSAGYDAIYQVISAAVRVLSISIDDVYQETQNLSPQTPYLDFKGKEHSIRLTIQKRDAKYNGYIADTKSYRNQQAIESKEWHWITGVYKELGPDIENLRHAAVEVLTFYRDKNTAQIENYVLNIFNEAILDTVEFNQQATVREFVYMMVAGAIFEAGLRGTITLPPVLKGKVITIDKATQEAIYSHFDREFESTVGASETTINAEGKFNRFFVNAIVMPKYVMPSKGVTIKEYPFIPMWFNSAGHDALRNNWASQGFIENNSFYGMSNYYKDRALLRVGRDWNEDRTSLYWYYKNSEEFRTTFPTDKEFTPPPHMADSLYPALQDEDPEDVEYTPRTDGRTDLHKFKVGTMGEITKESMLNKFPELREYFDVKPKLPEPNIGFRLFTGYEAEDFYLLKSYDNLPVSPEFSDKVKLLEVLGDKKAYLANQTGDEISYVQVEELDADKYAVVQVQGRKYLMEDAQGRFWLVRV